MLCVVVRGGHSMEAVISMWLVWQGSQSEKMAASRCRPLHPSRMGSATGPTPSIPFLTHRPPADKTNNRLLCPRAPA